MEWLVLALIGIIWTISIVLTCKRIFTPEVKGWIIVKRDDVDKVPYFFLEPINKPEFEEEIFSGKIEYITFRIRK